MDRDPDPPRLSDASVMLFAAGALIATAVAVVMLLG